MGSSNPAAISIASMEERHWRAVQRIYQAGIDTGHATFESSAPASWEKWRQGHLNEYSVVALGAERVVGWATLGAVSGRCVYSGVAEVSVYVAVQARGTGVGGRLLAALIERSEAGNIWSLQAGVFPENAASIALHESLGFRRVGIRRGLGKMSHGSLAGRWRDVLLLERRSARIGID